MIIPIQQRLTNIENDVTAMKADVADLKSTLNQIMVAIINAGQQNQTS